MSFTRGGIEGYVFWEFSWEDDRFLDSLSFLAAEVRVRTAVSMNGNHSKIQEDTFPTRMKNWLYILCPLQISTYLRSLNHWTERIKQEVLYWRWVAFLFLSKMKGLAIIDTSTVYDSMENWYKYQKNFNHSI